jgi:putative FmdB family regulatory protein
VPVYRYICPSCNHSMEEIRTVDRREEHGKCGACGSPTDFQPFGRAAAVNYGTDYHKATSMPDVALDHIVGESAEKGNMKMAETFQAKNKLIREGKATVFRQDKAAYRPAYGVDLPQIVSQQMAARSPELRQQIKEGRLPNADGVEGK